MPLVARCPSCARPLSEAAVLALAPVCSACASVLTQVGGSLGLTSAYGVNDANISRDRLQADLRIINEYVDKYKGMIDAGHEQLRWSVERYAELPQPPDLLAPVNAPSTMRALMFPLVAVFSALWLNSRDKHWGFFLENLHFENIHSVGGCLAWPFIWLAGLLVMFVAPIVLLPAAIFSLVVFLSWLAAAPRRAMVERVNSSRMEEHEKATAAALLAAEPRKRAQDYRLRLQIRDAEGLLRTLEDKRRELLNLQATL